MKKLICFRLHFCRKFVYIKKEKIKCVKDYWPTGGQWLTSLSCGRGTTATPVKQPESWPVYNRKRRKEQEAWKEVYLN